MLFRAECPSCVTSHKSSNDNAVVMQNVASASTGHVTVSHAATWGLLAVLAMRLLDAMMSVEWKLVTRRRPPDPPADLPQPGRHLAAVQGDQCDQPGPRLSLHCAEFLSVCSQSHHRQVQSAVGSILVTKLGTVVSLDLLEHFNVNLLHLICQCTALACYSLVADV